MNATRFEYAALLAVIARLAVLNAEIERLESEQRNKALRIEMGLPV